MGYLRRDNLIIPQGATWAVRWPIQDDEGLPFDLTEWAVRSHVRRRYNSPEILHEWSSALGNAELGVGYVELRVTPEESSAWTWIKTTPVFDVELFSNKGTVLRITQGTITVSPEVTR